MGHKLSPKSLRTGVFFPWRSRWFSERGYAQYAAEDAKIRQYLQKKLFEVGLEGVEIERSGTRVKAIVSVSRPGLVIGRGGGGVEILREEIGKITGSPIELEVVEAKEPALSAPLLADRVSVSLARRGRRYRRVLNEIVEETMGKGAKGVKIEIAGRVGGAEIARREKFSKGSIPLSTLRANIDFSQKATETRYGKIGVKVWVYKGELEGKI